MIRPFRFWCNKILPLVYDDVLSYQELLCKVVDYLNKVIDQTNANTDYINTLAGMVTDFMKSPEVKEIIEAKLDEMAEDGTLDAIINQPKMFVPNEEYRAQYKGMVLKAAGDFLKYMKDSRCATRQAELPSTSLYKVVYNTNGKGWQSLVAKDGIYTQDFDYDDYDNGTHILYSNCTGFVIMCTMGRGYKESPYYAAFVDGVTDPTDLKSYCCEYGERNNDYPWTLDFLQWQHSYEMYYIMQDSGCTPLPIYDMTSGWNEKNFNNLESGDILFDSRDGNSYPDGIHHCMIYVKDLAELTAANSNVTFNAYPFTSHNDTGRGYIVHCSHGYDPDIGDYDPTYPDAIRIETLEHFIWQAGNNHNKHVCYASKPYANPLNSNKRKRTVDFTTVTRNEIMFGRRHYNGFPALNKFNSDTSKWTMNDLEVLRRLDAVSAYLTTANADNMNAVNMSLRGQFLFAGDNPPDSVDIDNVGNGLWLWTSEQTTNISNLPSQYSGSGELLQFGYPYYSWYTQLLFGAGDNLYYRSCRRSGETINWSGWKKFTLSSAQEELP